MERLCVTCQFYTQHGTTFNGHKCLKQIEKIEKNSKTILDREYTYVTGDVTVNRLAIGDLEQRATNGEGWRLYCVLQRKGGLFNSLLLSVCGESGRWWKPKLSTL